MTKAQLQSIRSSLPVDETGTPILNAGDYFITKHSNLSSFNIVFHLVYDDDDLSGQSPVILG
jgi:Uncharacterised conserved protein (DUF2362)